MKWPLVAAFISLLLPPCSRECRCLPWSRCAETRPSCRPCDRVSTHGEGGSHAHSPAVTSAVKLQLFLPESVDVTEGESVTLPCSFSSPPTVSSALYITWLTMPTGYIIYDSHLGNLWLGRAEFAGEKEKGDCSLRLLNVATTLSPVFQCDVICTSCGMKDWKVEREVKLNVTAAAPRSGGETSPTPRVHSRWKTAVAGGLILGVVAAIVVYLIYRRSRSGDGQADVHGDVEKNGHPLMEVNEDKGGNGDKGTDTV